MSENNLEIENNSFNYINPQLNNEQQQFNNNINNINRAEIGIGNNIIHPNKPGVDGYKVFIRQDGFPDFGNFINFDDRVEFEPKNYKRPDIYFGFVHDQYLVPTILGLKNKKNEKDKEKKEEEEEKQTTSEGKQTEGKKIKSKKNKKINTVKNLDDIMAKFNLKYIEPPKIEKIVEPPPEEENVEEEENPKDKNKKGAKDSANAKGKNVKDDKTKANVKTNKK